MLSTFAVLITMQDVLGWPPGFFHWIAHDRLVARGAGVLRMMWLARTQHLISIYGLPSNGGTLQGARYPIQS